MAYNIRTTHPKYAEFIESWTMMRDCVAGEEDVKAHGERYLPMKSGMRVISDPTEQLKAYQSYQLRAEFPELLAPTILGSSGLLHMKEPTIELPPQMEYLREDATRDGRSLEAFRKELTNEILTTGRYGILPGVNPDGTFYLAGYTAETIINWDTKDGKPNYVVLDESDMVRDPITNTWAKKEMFLELMIDENGSYVANRYDGDVQVEVGTPALTARREALKEIPFVFVNVTNQLPNPDDIPLYGLARISIRIYRMDADYTHSLHMTSEPTPWVSGYDDPKKAIEQGAAPRSIGASTIWILPKGAQAGFLEFNGPGLNAQAAAITAALERATIFGAQILSEQGQAAESGESRRLRLRSQQSILATINTNNCAALEKALRNIAVWMGLDPTTVSVTPPDDLIDYTLSPQEITALVSGWQSGAYSKATLFFNLHRAGVTPPDRTFEEEEGLIESEVPPLGKVTAPPPGNNQNGGQNDPNNQNPDPDPNQDQTQ